MNETCRQCDDLRGAELIVEALQLNETGTAIQILTQNQASVHAALLAAIDHENAELVRVCLSRGGADLQRGRVSDSFQSFGERAAVIGNLAVLRLLVEAGATTVGCAWQAAVHLHEPMLRYLFELGAVSHAEAKLALVELAPHMSHERLLPLAQLCNTGDGESLDKFAKQTAHRGYVHCERWRLRQAPPPELNVLVAIAADARASYPEIVAECVAELRRVADSL